MLTTSFVVLAILDRIMSQSVSMQLCVVPLVFAPQWVSMHCRWNQRWQLVFDVVIVAFKFALIVFLINANQHLVTLQSVATSGHMHAAVWTWTWIYSTTTTTVQMIMFSSTFVAA